MSSQLTELGFLTEEVLVRKGNAEKKIAPKYLTVRGLSGRDILKIVRVHQSSIALVVGAVQMNQHAKTQEEVLSSTERLMGFVLELAPDLATEIIAVGCGAEGEDTQPGFEAAERLPFPLQLKILEKIAELTFVDQTPGEFLEAVTRMMSGTSGLLKNLSASEAGPKA